MFESDKDKKAQSAKDRMMGEVSHIGDELKETAHHLKGDARDAAAAVRDDLEDVARKAGSHVREFADSAEHGLRDAGGAVVAKIRDNPIQSSLIALGLGLVAGMLYRR